MLKRRKLLDFSIGAFSLLMMGQPKLSRALGIQGSPTKSHGQRIAEAWYAHNAMLVMMGAQNQIVATVATPADFPWMFKLVPALHQALPLKAGRLNPEALLELGCTLAFLPKAEAFMGPVLDRAGIKAVSLGFTDFSGLLACVDLTATTLGTSLAARRAQAYKQAFLTATLEDTYQPHGPRVLHIPSLMPLQVDGANTIIAEWIEASGGRNAAVTIRGNHRPVTAEQIAVWDPDIIILAANAGALGQLKRDPVMGQLRAVREGRVYRNPAGLFLWDRYGPELLLQLSWARQIVASGNVDVPVMVTKTIAFYREFYGIVLKPEEAVRMLAALPPA